MIQFKLKKNLTQNFNIDFYGVPVYCANGFICMYINASQQHKRAGITLQ